MKLVRTISAILLLLLVADIGLILVTNNVKEFIRVPALQIENWVSSEC